MDAVFEQGVASSAGDVGRWVEFSDMEGGVRILVQASTVVAVREFGNIGSELITTAGTLYVTQLADEAIYRLDHPMPSFSSVSSSVPSTEILGPPTNTIQVN